MLKEVLIVIILISAVPLGYLLAYLCRDELKQGRKWFKLLVFVSVLLAVIFLFFNLAIALTLFFISIVSLISLIKSYDKRFAK